MMLVMVGIVADGTTPAGVWAIERDVDDRIQP